MKAESGNYLIEQAGDHPLLTAEEERDLSRTYRKGSAAQAKLARARSPQTKASLQKLVARGEEARQRMISSNIKLVVSTTARYLRRFDPVSNGGIGLDDAIQDGILGLMRAVEDYDPELGWRFSTYATWWIRQFVQRGIDNAGPTIRIPVHMADRRRLIKRVREQLQKKSGHLKVGAAEVARETHLSEKDVAFADRLPWTSSLDEHVSFADGERDKLEFIPDGTNVEEEALQKISSAGLLKIAREVLNPLQFNVLRLRYEEELTLQETGDRLGFTRERARQHQKEALRKLGIHFNVNGSD